MKPKTLTVFLMMLTLGILSAYAAPTPTAVWEAGEFEKTKNGYSIVLNGNSIDAGGRIAIDSSAGSNLGAYIDVSSAGSKKATVLIKYSNLQPLANSNRSLTSMYLEWSPQSADVGARTKSANTLPITGFTSGNSNTYDFTEEENVPSFVAGTGHIILAIDSDVGTSCYTGETLDSMSGGTSTGLKYKSYTIRKIAVGGANTVTRAYSWDGVKIEKVAIFIGETYTNDDLSDYEWPNAQTPMLGEGITAYYDCETHTDSGTTVTVTGKSWDGSTLTDPGNLSLQWNCNDGAGIGTPSTTKFGLCYSGGGTGGRCWQSSTCDGLLPGTSAGDWSFSFWLCGNRGNQFVNTPGEGDNQGFRITKDGSNHIVVAVSETTDGTTFNTVSITSDASYTFNSSHWHNVIVVRSGNTLMLYVDGTEAGTATMAAGSYLVNASNTLTMADSSSGGIGQGNGSDEYCVWNRALSYKEVLAIAVGTSTIGAMAETIPTVVSLEETGGYVKTATQIAFKNTTLDEITASTLKGRFGGESAGDEKGTEATFCCFATSSEGAKTCEAQISSGEYIKAVLLAFEQVDDDVTVTARGACYKTGGTLGQSVEADKTADSVISTSPTVAGYGLYNLRLPRTPETSATVVWETGEFEMAKVGPDGYEYSFSSFGGLSVNGDGNLVVGTANAQGAIVNLPDTSKTAVSVLIKYSNLAAESGGNATLANCAINSGNTTYYLGARTMTAGTLPLTAYYAGSAYPFDNATYGHGNVPSMDTGGGYFLFAHGSSNGTYAYSGETIGALDGGYNEQLKWGGYNITQVSIGGGFENNRAYCWKGNGTVIERVAIFLGSIKTPGDLSDYYFPSAVAKSYEKWEYAKGMVTWNTTANSNNELAGSNSQYTLFDLQSGVDTSTTYGGTSSYQIFDSTKSATFWNYLSNGSVSDGVYQAPGVALRFAGTSATKTIGGTFGPVTLGGMYVERGAEGYSFQQAGHSRRSTILGSANSADETWFKFEEPFEVRRTGTLCLSGNINIELPKATDVLTLNANADNGNANYAPNVVATVTGLSNDGNVYIGTHTTAGGTLRMHGAGHIAAAKLVASGATLDFSDLGSRYNDATPFINCPLVVDGDTKFVFPKAVELPYTYKVATSITVNGDMPTCEYVDANGSVYAFELSVDEANGTVTVPTRDEAKSVLLNLGTSRDTYAFPAGLTALKISATELLSEDGLFSLVIGEGLDANVIDLILTNQNGEEVTTDVTYSGDTLTATYAPTVSGKACWIDYEMTYVSGDSNKTGFENSGTDTTKLSSDSGITGDNAFNQDTGMLYTYAHPWRNMTGVNAYPASWTAVVRCTVPAYENAAIITFGTCNGGLIGLVAGHDPETQMKLVKTTGNSAFTVLSEMTVQNATTAQHVYVFSVEDNQTIKIYCDGEPVLNETYDAFTLGGGIQVGSVHGGVNSTGIVRFAKGESPANTLSETVQKAARIDCVRLFKTVLGPKAIEQLSVEFPAMKLYKATVSAGASKAWDELDWTPAWDGGNAYSKIILTSAGAATVTMPEKITAEDFTINAADGTTLSLVGDNTILAITNPIEVNGGAVSLSGTMEANVEITGELAVEGLTLAGDGTLTLDGTITATGAVTLQDKASVAIKSGATINVTSGLFNAIATTFTLGPKTMATDNEDGTYTFEVAKAQIGETRYNTVEAAIAAFTDHNTVLEIFDDTYEAVSLEGQGIFWNESTRTYSYAAATIGTTYFQTLEAALTAASAGEEKSVTLFKNDTGAVIAIPAGVALKLGGYTIAATPTTVDGYVIGITEGDTVYTSITNDAAEWVGGASDNWSVYSNWSTGAVPGANTVVTIPEGTFTIGITDYNSSAHKCAAMIVDGTATFAYSGDGDYWPELTLYGGISGSGKIIIRRAGLRNVSGSPVTIACAFGVEYNDTTNDSFLRGDNFNITGNMTVGGYLKIEEGTTAIATGVATLGNGANIRALNTATLTIAELVAPDGVTATVGTSGSGTLTVAKMTGAGDVTFTNCTITLLDDYTGTLGGTMSIGTVNADAIDPEERLVEMASGFTVSNLAETTVTEGGDPTEYRLYAKEDGLYVKTALAVFRSAATGGWLDANSWTNANGETVDWTTDYLMYANIDAGQIESIDIGESDNVEMAKLTITGGETSSLTLTIDGTIAIDQELDLSGMAGTIVKDGAGKFTAVGDNASVAATWSVIKGTLSLGGEFDSVGGVGTVVNLDGGVLDIAGAHGGQHSKTLVVNGAGSVFTNSVGVAESYGHSFPFAHIQVKADSSFGGDEEWGAIASAYGASNIDIAEGCTFTKIGAGKFCINNMAISGAGTLKVAAGVLDKGGTCTVDNLEIDNWSNVSGGGSLTVNRCVTLNNEADATVSLADRSVTLGNNASLKLNRAGTLEIGTWRGNNLIDMTEAGGKLSLTLTGNDELDIALNVAGLDESYTSNVIINDGAAPGTHALYRSGKLLHIARNVGGMVINPVTGERTVVTYVFAGEDGAWQTVSNWRQYDDTYDNYANLESGNAPTLTGSNRWEPTLFDGSRLSSEAAKSITLDGTVEGWELKLAVANGMAVSVPTINKLQGNSPMWIMVDDTSTLTFGAWGSGNSSNSLTYYVANEDGVTWNMAFNKGISLEYYLAGAGSVNYAAGVTAGTHSIKRAELTLGTGDYTTIVRRALVKFSSSSVTFDTSELEVLSDEAETPAVLADSALMGTEAVGTYQVLKEATGIYLEYIGRTETAPKEYVISGSGTKTWTWDDPAPGADDAVTIKLTGNMALNLGEEAITIGRLVVLNEGTEDVATLTLSGATLNAGSIIVGEAVEVASSVAAQLAGTLQGSGTVTYTGVMPTGLVMNDNGWKGVLWLKSVALAGPKPGTLAGDHSTLRLTGCTGYFNDNGTAGQNPQISYGTLDLRDDGETVAFTVDNGWSSDGVTVFGKLTGDGTLGCSTRNIAQRYVFIDPSEFIGTINCARTDDTSKLNLRVILGDGATLNPDDGTITIVAGATATMLKTWTASSIINNGTLHLAIDPSGNLVNNGALVLLADNLNLQGVRDFAHVELGTGVTQVQVNQTQSEYLNGNTTFVNVPDGIASIRVNKFDGETAYATSTGDGVYKISGETMTLGGKATLYDFTFTPGRYTTEVDNTGSRGGTLNLDGSSIGNALDSVSGNLYVRTHPYVDVGNYPTEFTVAVYGTMPQDEYNTMIAFGRRNEGTLALVKGSTENDVNLIWAKGDGTGENYQLISSMRAKASTEENHLYVFEKTANSISVYLDGREMITVTSTDDNPWPLGNNGGFQVGSVLQGAIDSVATRPSSTDPAMIAAVRIYGEKITAEVMAALKAAFPFVDAASDSERTLDAEDGRNDWYGEEAGTWTNTPDDVEDAGHLPRTNANVTLTVAGEVPQRIDVVLNGNTVDEPNIIGDLHITGSQALTIRKSIGGHPVSVSGILTNDVDLTVHYGAIDLEYTGIYLGENATLTFELSELLKDKRDTNRVYLTGVCEDFGTTKVTCTYDENADTFIKFMSSGWDSVTQRYYVDFKSPRTARDVWFDPIPGADVTNVLSMAIEVYYTDGTGTKTSPILTGDTLHFKVKEGYEAVVQVPAGEMKLVGYDIPEDVTVIFEEAITNRVSGAGTIVMDGCWPKVSLAAVEASFANTANWTGTVDISNVNFGNASLPKLGNANSTIRLSGCSLYPQAPYEVTAKLEIYGDGLDFRGISSGSNQEVIFDRLIGSGSLMNTNTTLEAVNYLRINNADDFTGAVTNLVGTSGGTTMLFGAGSSAEGSVVITTPCEFNLVSPVYASTNLVVNGTLKVSEPGVVVTAEKVLFDSGIISIADPDAYPFFELQNQIEGTITIDLVYLPSTVTPASIQVMRVNNTTYLPDRDHLALGLGKVSEYALVKDADGRGWSLVRKGFYIRIR